MSTTNIVLTGVGGQGILLAGEIISQTALKAGYDVKRSEIHGMAQRGGNVNSHIRFGQKVYSPIVMKGCCDLLVAFEKMESLRSADYLKPDGTIIVNLQRINPSTVSSGFAKYPENVEEILTSHFKSVIFVDGLKLALEAGNIRTVNIAVLGVAAKKLNLPIEIWEEVIATRVPQRVVEANLKAFRLGLQMS